MEEKAINLLNELIKVYAEMDLCATSLMYERHKMKRRLDPNLPPMLFN